MDTMCGVCFYPSTKHCQGFVLPVVVDVASREMVRWKEERCLRAWALSVSQLEEEVWVLLCHVDPQLQALPFSFPQAPSLKSFCVVRLRGYKWWALCWPLGRLGRVDTQAAKLFLALIQASSSATA